MRVRRQGEIIQTCRPHRVLREQFYIRDTSSSSGTFLNHIRLSSPNTDSRPTPLNVSDLHRAHGLKLTAGRRCSAARCGLSRRGRRHVPLCQDESGTRKGVAAQRKRVQVRELLWGRRRSLTISKNALKQLKALGGNESGSDLKGKNPETPVSSKKGKASVTDCCICLFSVTVCQSLFIA